MGYTIGVKQGTQAKENEMEAFETVLPVIATVVNAIFWTWLVLDQLDDDDKASEIE